MSLLITPSIWNAAQWRKDAPRSWQESAEEQLVNQLSRVPMGEDIPHVIKRGLDFESTVEVCCRRDVDSWTASKKFIDVVDRCRGGKWQQVAKKTIDVDGEEHLLYGRIDILFPEEIVDLKTTNKHRAPGHYLKGIQHKIYSYATGIPEFVYLVVVMDDDDQIVESYEVEWTSPPADELEADLARMVRNFRNDLRLWALEDIYLEKFCRK